MNDLYLITYNTMFLSLPSSSSPIEPKSEASDDVKRREEEKKSNRITALKKCLFFVKIFFFLFSSAVFQWENFPYSMMRETFFLFRFHFKFDPTFFSSSMVCEWVLLSFFSRVSLFYVLRVKCSSKCRSVIYDKIHDFINES